MDQQLLLPHLPPTGVAKQVLVTATDVRKPEGNIKLEYVGRERRTMLKYEGWNFNRGNYLFTTDTK